MDQTEARQVLTEILAQYRQLSYSDLLARNDQPVTVERVGPSGTNYQIEMQVFVDDSHRQTLRVLGAIDDFSARWTRSPLCDDFIIAPDGTFVGE